MTEEERRTKNQIRGLAFLAILLLVAVVAGQVFRARNITDLHEVGGLTKVTAYCPCPICCGKWADGVTASGYKIKEGDVFVAAPKEIPFGTMLIIPNYNQGRPVEVKDRGGAIKFDRLDVYFDDHQTALEWGVQFCKVEGE